MHKIKSDKSKKIIYLTVSGYFDLKSAMLAVSDMEKYVSKLEKGYNVICDIRNFHTSETHVLNQITHGTQVFDRYGRKYTVHVVGSSKEALVAFAKYSDFATHKDRVCFVSTPSEAERKMKELTSRIDEAQVNDTDVTE